MKSHRLAIVGLSGRMGREIETLAPKCGFEVVNGVTRTAVPVAAGQSVQKMADLAAASFDLMIDYSTAAFTNEVLRWCTANKKPLVSGVTGLSDEQTRAMHDAAKTIPIFWSPNMSPGVAVLKRMIAELSKLPEFDFQVEELHHARKLDRPSGTALALQKSLADAVKKPLPEPVAIRGGGSPGIHRVFAMGEEETLILEHTATSRTVFARGTLRAATWLLTRPPGMYSMDHLLS